MVYAFQDCSKKKEKISFIKKVLLYQRFEIKGVEFCTFELVEVDI